MCRIRQKGVFKLSRYVNHDADEAILAEKLAECNEELAGINPADET